MPTLIISSSSTLKVKNPVDVSNATARNKKTL